MYKVVSASKYAGKIVSFTVQNLENGETGLVRPKQLRDFCILRKFKNAEYTEGNLIPIGEGFNIRENILDDELRMERLYGFYEQICPETLECIAYEESRNLRKDPVNFMFTVGGRTGTISAYPGTEWFNKLLPQILTLKGIKLGVCKCINSSSGNHEVFAGWIPDSSVPGKHELGDTFFSIEKRPYTMPAFAKDHYSDWSNVDWVLNVHGDIKGSLFLSRDNHIVFSRLRKSV